MAERQHWPPIVICHVMEIRPSIAGDRIDSISTTTPAQISLRSATLKALAEPQVRPPSFLSHQDYQQVGTMLHATCTFVTTILEIMTVLILHFCSDNQFGRVFQSGNLAGSDLTIESCIAICQGSNFTLAGTEFADECCKCYTFVVSLVLKSLTKINDP